MAADRTYVTENAAELRRLRALVDRLSDADLARPTPGGWTVAASLAHVAFWDQRVLFWLDRWDQGAAPRELRSLRGRLDQRRREAAPPRAPAPRRGPAGRGDRRAGGPSEWPRSPTSASPPTRRPASPSS